MQRITPFLWFDGKAEQAMNFYVSIFKNSKVVSVTRYGEEGGQKQRCGWLKDKYGVSWQVLPSVLGKMLQDKDAEKSKAVMKAMLQMDKIDIQRLKQAYDRASR
jgi:predicted 3-demethylubiquinone-9 3-methyltransferase (glyoxalase superfamily)